MSRGRRKILDGPAPERVAQRISDLLEDDPVGLHQMGSPALMVDSDWPSPLAAVYRCFDGAELFHGAIVLSPSAQVARDDGHWSVGEIAGDDLYVTPGGGVMRGEADTDEIVPEGSRFDLWFLGAVEAEGLLYEDDGEFRDGVFDANGELLPTILARRCRRILDRDTTAPAPRWRLARALLAMGQVAAARDELETVVAGCSEFPWAWFDLAQISERLGELEGARDEMCAAAEAVPDYEHAGFLWAHAARLAHALGDEASRAGFADKAMARAPDLVREQRAGAEATLDAGDPESARLLAELAAALAPRDLTVLDLLARIRAALTSAPPQGA